MRRHYPKPIRQPLKRRYYEALKCRYKINRSNIVRQKNSLRPTKTWSYPAACTLGTFILSGLTNPLQALPTSYTVTDLGGLSTYATIPNDINNAGQVVGRSQTGSGEHAFLWASGTITDLGTLGGTYSEAKSINDAGKIVGTAYVSGGTAHPFSYESGSMTDLLGGSSDKLGWATDINNAGTIIGQAQNSSYNLRPVKFASSSTVDLSAQGMTTNAVPHAINDVGTIAEYKANRANLFVAGTEYLLPTIGGTQSQSTDINILGQVCGGSLNTGNLLMHAFLYQPAQAGGTTGSTIDLGTLGGSESIALKMNAWGVVVGRAEISPNNASRAFVYTECSAMVNLNTLIPSNSGWVLEMATGINDKGQIVGVGSKNGVSNKGFLLTPN